MSLSDVAEVEQLSEPEFTIKFFLGFSCVYGDIVVGSV